jgi:hypothetical protein
MKDLLRLLSLLLIPISFVSCERDDICVDEVTPKLILRFYDTENPELFKQVVNLKVNISGNEEDYTNETITALTDSIALPINVNDDQTSYVLTLEESEILETEENTDILLITYTQEDLFVSRPCGYKAIFNEVVPRIEEDDDNWIDQVVIVRDPLDISNENAAHVKIYH